jgi:hypothetical protein
MPSNVQSVSFVNPLDPIASGIQQQEIARQQALADRLREESLQDTQVAPGSSISWTQGLARLADALVANKINRKNMAAQYDLGTQAQNAQRGMHGLPPIDSTNPYSTSEQGRNLGQRIGDFVRGGPPVDPKAIALARSLQGNPATTTDPQQTGTTSQQPGGTGQIGPTGTSVNSIPAPTESQPGLSASSVSTGMPPASPPSSTIQTTAIPPLGTPQQSSQVQSPNQTAVPQSEPMDPTMPWLTAAQGYTFALTNPEGAKAAQAAFNTPTDGLKAVAQAGIDPNSPQGKAFLLAYAQKTTQTPVGDDRRGYIYDPYSGKPIGYHPQLETGQQPTADANGNVNGVRTLPGFAQSTEEISGAHARGNAQGEIVNVVGPDGRSYAVPKSALLDGNGAPSPAQPGSGSPTRGAGGAGSINSLVGAGAAPKGVVTGLSPTELAAGKTYGASSGNAFATIQDAARDAPQRISALREMDSLVQGGFQTGPSRARMQEIATEYGLPFGTTDNGFIFNKDAARYTAQLANELGLNGSDARLGQVSHATPGMQITPVALKQMIPVYMGLEMAKSARGSAAANWVASHGPASNADFESQWRQNYDPTMFTALAKGKAYFKANYSHLNPQTQAQIRQKYNNLAAMGVDFDRIEQ